MTIEDVKEIVGRELNDCDAEQRATFHRYAVDPYWAEILRYGRLEKVAVVARKGNRVIYWEDEEEGFNISPVDESGRILQHLCNQDELRHALNAWIDGRESSVPLGPAIPIQE